MAPFVALYSLIVNGPNFPFRIPRVIRQAALKLRSCSRQWLTTEKFVRGRVLRTRKGLADDPPSYKPEYTLDFAMNSDLGSGRLWNSQDQESSENHVISSSAICVMRALMPAVKSRPIRFIDMRALGRILAIPVHGRTSDAPTPSRSCS
jgi:hypothetical protein